MTLKSPKNIPVFMINLLLIIILLSGYSNQQIMAQSSSPISQEEFDSLKSSVDKTESVLDNIENRLQSAKKYLGQISNDPRKGKEAKALLEKITETEKILSDYKKPLKSFNTYAGKVSTVTDVYIQIYDIHEKFQKDKELQGDLGANLRLLSTAMQNFGDKVPLIGDAIKAYGDITSGLLDKTMEVGLTIDQARNQGAISGPGTYATGYSREKNLLLKEKYPYLADNYTYVPVTPGYVYRSTENGHPLLIWDQESKDFYLVKEDVPVEKIFKLKLLVDQRPGPKDLKNLTENWDSIGLNRYKSGLLIQTLFEKVAEESGYSLPKQFYYQVKDTNSDLFYDMFHDTENFEARYMFDANYRATIDNTFLQFYLKLDSNESTKSIAKELFNLVKTSNYNIQLPPPKEIIVSKPPQTKPKRIEDNNNYFKPYQPPQNNYNTQTTTTYQPGSTNQTQIDEQTKKLTEFETGRKVCSAYMQSLTNHYNDYDATYGKYWVKITRSYEYEDGNCVGSHEIWRKVEGKDPYAEVIYYSPEDPAKLPVSSLKSHWSKEYPSLDWGN
ncbi:MAG: hypothetical protein AB1782_15765 [Cyanobacteriota bacterium]